MKNEKGLTLVEILASIVILTIISMLVFNLIVSSKEQQKVQEKDQANLFDLTYTLKLITKDFRMSTSYDPSSKTFSKNGKTIASYSFDAAKNELSRDSYNASGFKIGTSLIGKNIKHFELTQTTNEIIIDITNNTNQNIKNTLYYRE